MYIEERDYRIKPGYIAQFVELYEKYGLHLQKKYLGTFIGYFISEIGELNHVVALWAYESLDHRNMAREKMLADSEWQSYLKRVVDLIDTQHSRILKPVSFSPIQ